MDKFSEILKELITEKEMSLRKLAEASKVSAIRYSKYLKGAMPRIDVAIRIAQYFDCSLDYLFGLSDEKTYKKYESYDMSKFVERYSLLLRENQISHWKFAKNNNISESSLRHWKYGDIPKIDTLIIIAKGLKSSIDYLVGRINKG